MIRPEVAAALARWREALVALATAAVGGWLLWRGVLRGEVLVQGLGAVLGLGGLAVALVAARRARFGRGGEGPGVVVLTERQITYLGPFGGGAALLDELDRIELADAPGAARVWRLHQPSQPALEIPVDARGAEQLIDILTALPGLDAGRLLRALDTPGDGFQTVWARKPTSPALPPSGQG